MVPKVQALVPEAKGGKVKQEKLLQFATIMADLEKLPRNANNRASLKKPNNRETSKPVEGKQTK